MLANGSVGRYLKPGPVKDLLLKDNRAHESCTRSFYEADIPAQPRRRERKKSSSKPPEEASHRALVSRVQRSPSPTPSDLLGWYHSRNSPPPSAPLESAGGPTPQEQDSIPSEESNRQKDMAPMSNRDTLRAANRLAAQKRVEQRAEREKLQAKQEVLSPESLLLAGISTSHPVIEISRT